MLYEEREARIMQQLQLHSTVKTGSLSQQLHVSVDTVRARSEIHGAERPDQIHSRRCLSAG